VTETDARADRWRKRFARWTSNAWALSRLARLPKTERSDIFAFLTELMKLGSRERNFIFSMDSSTLPIGQTNASTRDAWVKTTLSNLPAGARLLDAGAGECVYKKYCGHLRYVSQDLAKYDGTGAVGLQTGSWDTSRIDIVSDITDIPEPDESFDAILCTEVLEHVTDPTRALHELARLLKKDGALIVTAPFCSNTHFAPYHYATGFSRHYYEFHLPRMGLEITELTENGNLFEFSAQQLRQIEGYAERYANSQPTRIERYAMQVVLAMLARVSTADRGSAETLNFGMHVRAVKRSTA
jgi:SAM-dependent methyltransferase